MEFIPEELLKKLDDAKDVTAWFPLIEDAIKVQTTKPVCSVVYVADVSSGDLFDARKNPLPNHGICWQAFQTKETKSTRLLDRSDPLTTIVKQKCTFGPKYVFCQPIRDGNQVISVIAVLTTSNQDFNPESLKLITDKIVGCYRRLCKCHTRTLEQNSTASSPVPVQTSSLKEAIIQLCGELYDQDAADLQIKVLKFLEDHTRAECAFLLLVVPETHELFCQVIRGKILEEELRFPGHTSSFALALERKLPITLDDIPVDKRPGIEDFVRCKLQSMLCVPVSSRANDKLIALACVVNKQDKDSFNNEDVHVIKQCFQYTSTVLTSTLAFQNERKLKIQTQAMLQVARNLFTHLGEFTKIYGKDVDNFPFIRSGMVEVNALGATLSSGIYRSHCRPYVPRVGCHQLNKSNSAMMEMNRKVRIEIERQGRLADQLTGFEDEKKASAEKGIKHQPRLKSPDKKKINLSPEKHHLKPYGKDKQVLDLENLDMSPILESTRYNKPDLVIGTEGAAESFLLLGESDDGKKIKLSLLENASHDNKGLSSREEDISELPPFTPTYQRTVRHFFTTPPIDDLNDTKMGDDEVSENGEVYKDSDDRSCDEDKEDNTSIGDNASYKTADSLAPSMMYSAEDITDEDTDLNESDTKESPFYDTWKERDASLDRSCSDTAIFDCSGNEEMLRMAQVTENDFEKVEARLSTSEPSLSNIEGISELAPDVTDSKPEFNDAFIKGSSESTIGDTTSAEEVRDNTAAEDFIDSSTDVILGNRTSSIVVEDVDTNQKLTLTIKVSESAVSKDDDSGEKHLQIVFGSMFKNTTDYIRSNDVPRTENIPLQTNDLTKLLREIMQEARNLTQAERCSVFLIDQETDELVAKVFDGILANDNEVQSEIRMPITQGIAGHVATTGNLLNIKDAYAHPMFYRGIDDSTGFRTRNILCFPIKNETDNVLGVAQLCNKMNGPYFTTFDEDVASAFAVYCCISISHSLMYQKVIAAQYRNSLANELMVYHMKSLMYQKLQQSQHRNKLANELMIYHMQVAYDEVQELAHSDILPVTYWNKDFSHFNFPPREVPESETHMCCLSMFEDLGFISRWRIKRDTLARFILMVRKGYRNPPYHNWMHAFAVAHFCYLCMKNLNLSEYLEDTELFALFVSCLCHDIDHRGTNNSYQVASKSVLAALYSSEGAVLERHHFAQTMCIVNTEGCNIYENLVSKDYTQVLDLMRDIILATDLAHHLKILKNIEAMAKEKYNKSNLKHRKLLTCLLMTASDLSDQTKPWDSAKHIAALIYNEFFSQGDLEKSLGRTPADMMDREKARIPDLQIGFLDHIALPVYRVLEEIFIDASTVHNSVKDNRKHWERICALIKLRRGGSCEQMSYDQILALEEEASHLPEEEVKSVTINGH